MAEKEHAVVDPTAPPKDPALRIKAIETLLVERNLLDPKVVDEIIDMFETKVGPRNGAKIIAKAWNDSAYRARLLKDGDGAVAELGFSGGDSGHIMVLENTPDVHNLCVCTLCSCYPWPTLGLPPNWYKSVPYRSRAVSEPRSVLKEFGVDLPATTEIRVWDSNSEIRYMVMPMRPEGTEGWSDEQLADLVTRDSMIGTGLPKAAAVSPSSPIVGSAP